MCNFSIFQATISLECFQCGTYVEEKKPTLGLINYLTDGTEMNRVPKCNGFNASLDIFRVKCKDYEQGCLKGWLTQVK